MFSVYLGTWVLSLREARTTREKPSSRWRYERALNVHTHIQTYHPHSLPFSLIRLPLLAQRVIYTGVPRARGRMTFKVFDLRPLCAHTYRGVCTQVHTRIHPTDGFRNIRLNSTINRRMCEPNKAGASQLEIKLKVKFYGTVSSIFRSPKTLVFLPGPRPGLMQCQVENAST